MKSKNLIRQGIKLLIKNAVKSLGEKKQFKGRDHSYMKADARLHYYLKGLEDGGNLRVMSLYREAKELAEKELKEEVLKNASKN